ncbi:MAG: glycosyltransferase, partial [Chloroflexota bacterium]
DLLAHYQDNDIRLLIVGDGPLRPTLERQVEHLNLVNKVIFTGFIPEADKPAYYNLADVVVCPSFLEGFGLTAAEAMSCGIPVVASDAGSLREVVLDLETGYIVPQNDVSLFAARIKNLLLDTDLRMKMGYSASKRVETKFRWHLAAQQAQGIYRDLLANKR